MQEVDVKEYLAETDEAFRHLLEKHQAYERQLEQLVQKLYLNPHEQLRKTEIKKKKLVLKDKMQSMISQYRQQQSAS
ncbi:MAG: DUF465 domain-containing protein [Acidobacteriota bacterium]